MSSFTVFAVGYIASDLELQGSGDQVRVQVPLIGNDYIGRDQGDNVRERATTVYFTAFGTKAQTIVKHCRRGDQLFVRARMQANNYTDRDGQTVYSYNYVIDELTFGAPGRAKREELARG